MPSLQKSSAAQVVTPAQWYRDIVFCCPPIRLLPIVFEVGMEALPREAGISSLTQGPLTQSFAMIIASEIGDKTFLIAAILAMRHPRGVVFAGAFGSLIAMSWLSAGMGHILPTLIPRRWTQVAAAALFLVFGSIMLREGLQMKAGNEKIQEELQEVREEIEDEEAVADGTAAIGENGEAIPLEAMEEGGRPVGGNRRGLSTSRSKPTQLARLQEGARNFFALVFGPVFVKAFILTFLGEWGDRSQIATIALAAAHNVYVVAIGTCVGHALCTALAVIGGRWLSTKISVKHVTLGGACLFLLFSVIYFYEAWTSEGPPLLTPSLDSIANEAPP